MPTFLKPTSVPSLYKQGFSAIQIATQVNLPSDEVYRLLWESGARMKSRGRYSGVSVSTPPFTKKERALVKRLYLSGQSMHEVALHFRCSFYKVRSTLRKMSVPARPGGSRRVS